jgi:hypothetical protein
MTTAEPAGGAPSTAPSAQNSAGPYDPELKAAGQLTSPTWELELFLSGAFVFAMFQLPGVVEELFSRIEPHATDVSASFLFTAALYAKAIAFTLIGMFLVHLIARAYWVALMGLHSVFPRGIYWSEMKIGPIAKDVYQTHIPDISRGIAKLDNFCSVVFSVGLLIVFIFAYSTGLVALLSAAGYLLAQLFTGGEKMRYFFFGLAAIFVVIPVVVTLYDRRVGNRLVPGSRPYRIVRRLLQFAFSLNLMRLTGPMMWTLATNVGRKKSFAFLYVVLFGLIMVATADRLAQSDRLSVNTYDFLGASTEHGIGNRFYENQRESDKPYPRIPSIQSDIIRDPYLKLFIPYYPRRHNVALARTCPGLKRLQERGLQIGADVPVPDSLATPALACLARLHAVSLDGQPRPDLEFAFYEQPRSGLRGIITYIPIDSLSRGRHVLRVLPAPPAELPTDSAALANAPWKRPYVIPFWR